MELDKVYELMGEFKKSGIGSLEIKDGDFCIKMSMPKTAPPTIYAAPPQMAAAPSAASQVSTVTDKPAAPLTPAGLFIKSPIVGTFYAAPGADQEVFASKGQKIDKGQTVCIVEAMKMMNEIAAPFDCVIEDILKSDAEAVGFDEPLFRIREL